MIRQIVRVLFAIALAFACSGCALVGALIDSYSRAGFTQGDREAYLAEAVRNFNEALYWNNQSKALSYVLDDVRATVVAELRRKKNEERVVETKIEEVTFSDNSYTADVELTIRSYRVPYYVVADHQQKQRWKFSTSSGWKLESLESIDSK